MAATLSSHRDDAGELVLERVEPGVAAGLISAAIALTDMTWDPPVSDDYWPGRAVALLRADQTAGVVAPEELQELPTAAREALLNEFLAAPEGAGFAPDSDEAWVASLAIDYAVGYRGDDPLRWSPPVVELFLLDWLPRRVLSTPEMLAVLPSALDAWVRFAGRKRVLAERYVAQSREAIVEFSAAAVEHAADPELAGPSKRFLMAAAAAGVDVEDLDALKGFMAGWNARSSLDELGAELAAGALPGSTSGAAAADPAPDSERILQVKVTLKGVTKPPVWRRLQVAASTRLDELHQIIQIAFGWEDYHLHMFEVGREDFGPADLDLNLDCADERLFTLEELAAEEGERIRYTYDFGDNWVHEIRLEAVLDPAPDVDYPRLVTAKGACPPEDCGGVWGYENLKAALADPASERHHELRDWFGLAEGETFDPSAVNFDAIRASLAEWRPVSA